MKDAAFGIPFSTWCFSLSPEEYLLNTAAQAASIDELLELTEDERNRIYFEQRKTESGGLDCKNKSYHPVG